MNTLDYIERNLDYFNTELGKGCLLEMHYNDDLDGYDLCFQEANCTDKEWIGYSDDLSEINMFILGFSRAWMLKRKEKDANNMNKIDELKYVNDNIMYFNTNIANRYELKMMQDDNYYDIFLVNKWNGEEKWLASTDELIKVFIFLQGFIKSWEIKGSNF